MDKFKKTVVIIPVFNQFELTVSCLASVLSTVNRFMVDIFVIDDASTDPRIEEYCHLLQRSEDIIFQRNIKNLGFTRSVNLSMKLFPGSDVILLNTDTVVYGDWVERLAAVAYLDKQTGTACPLTNSGGSQFGMYPKSDIEVLSVGDHSQIDCIAKYVNQDCVVNVHTSVGFCMFIKRECLKSVGYFDEIHFPRAYGEESDFCYRASYIGWKHVVATNVFVSHFHGKSFGSEKHGLMHEMLSTFERLHPQFYELDRRAVFADLFKQARRRLDIGRMRLLVSKRMAIVSSNHAEYSSEEPIMFICFTDRVVSFSFKTRGREFLDLPNFALPEEVFKLRLTLDKLGLEGVSVAPDCEEWLTKVFCREVYEFSWNDVMQGLI